METLSGTAEPAPLSPSLDKAFTTARQRGRRMYHRVMSGLEKGGSLRLITLTTASQNDNKDFQKHFRMLRMRLLRRGLMVDYIRCREETKNGLRHEHILFRGSYIDQAFLSHLWKGIHRAPIVDIRSIRHRRGLASYLAKYASKAVLSRTAYSWGWVWRGFAHSWALVKKVGWQWGCPMAEILTFWRWCIKLNYKPDERMVFYLQ